MTDVEDVYLSSAGAGAARRIGVVPRPLTWPAPTLTGKGTACWVGADGERL